MRANTAQTGKFITLSCKLVYVGAQRANINDAIVEQEQALIPSSLPDR